MQAQEAWEREHILAGEGRQLLRRNIFTGSPVTAMRDQTEAKLGHLLQALAPVQRQPPEQTTGDTSYAAAEQNTISLKNTSATTKRSAALMER